MGHARYYRLVPMTEYESDKQDLSKLPPVPAQEITPPPFSTPLPQQPEEILTPPAVTSPPEFYQVFQMNNGIEEPVTSLEKFLNIQKLEPPVLPMTPPPREITIPLEKLIPVSCNWTLNSIQLLMFFFIVFTA